MIYLCAPRYTAYTGTTPSITLSRSSCFVGQAIWCNARATVSGAIANIFRDLQYSWSVFDHTGTIASWGNWPAVTGLPTRARNIEQGPIVCFIPRTADTFTIQLVVFDGLAFRSTTTTLTVGTENAAFPTTATYVVDPDGDFTGKPTGAQEITDDDYTDVINNQIGDLTGKRVLFRGGQTFTCDGPTNVTGTGFCIGAFGTGNALLTNTSGTPFNLNSASPISNGLIRNISPTGPGDSTQMASPGPGSGGLSQITISNITATAFNQFVSASIDEGAIVECNFSAVSGTTGYGIIGGPANAYWAELGNVITPGANAVHTTRHGLLVKGVISGNTYTCALTAIDCNGPTFTGANYSEYIVLSWNRFIGSAVASSALVGFTAQFDGANERLRNIISERNIYVAGSGTDGFLEIASDLTISRNDTFIMTNAANQRAITIFRKGTSEKIPDDVQILNVSAYDGTTGGTSNLLEFTTPGTNVYFDNTSFYAPNVDTANMKTGSAGAGYVLGANNTSDPKGASPFTDTTPASPAAGEFNPANYAVAGGLYSVTVYDDILGTQRSYGNKQPSIDMGAVQTTVN